MKWVANHAHNPEIDGLPVKEMNMRMKAQGNVNHGSLTSRLMRVIPVMAVLLVCRHPSAIADTEYQTRTLQLRIDDSGHLVSLRDRVNDRELLAPDQPAPLMTLKSSVGIERPAKAEFLRDGSTIRLGFTGSKVTADVEVDFTETHIRFTLEALDPLEEAMAVIWGPYPTVVGESVGEVIGVVHDAGFALGIRGLNIRTLGGYPGNSEGLNGFRGETAVSRPWGSLLQAYSMDRSRPRTADVWNGHFPNMPVPPIPGETVIGSSIALFGCRTDDVPDVLEKIIVAEGLPYPRLDGQWTRKSSEAGRSYMIADFSEDTVDELLGHVSRSGLAGLYHGNPFRTWGHYESSPRFFPNGVDGVRDCAEKASAMGLRIGVHTLTTFIQPDDPYVTPIPDPRLARTGSSALTASVSADAAEIPVASPEYFNNTKANWMRTVIIGEELIRYRTVSDAEPWRLLDCQRGAFGTTAAPHPMGTEVGKLLDHPYKVFFPNLELQREIAANLAGFFNRTGVRQMDFDGHEGALATGQGTYAIDLFAKDFYDHLDHTVINGTSLSTHYYWLINSYSNWGEPWYGGFRESMQEYRINNQKFFERNFMPNMLGWYLMTDRTHLSDMEWMLARAAGYDAGFAMATSLQALRGNPRTAVLLDAIREWERARMNNAFSPDQRERLKNPDNEFHLSPVGANTWDLYPIDTTMDYTHAPRTLQPGEPTASTWKIDHSGIGQPLQFRLEVTGDSGSIHNPAFEVDNFASLTIPVSLEAGQTLLCEGTGTVRIFDAKGNHVREFQLSGQPPKLVSGAHLIAFDCEFDGPESLKAVVNFRLTGQPEKVMAAGE
jgi:hypothetical protein